MKKYLLISFLAILSIGALMSFSAATSGIPTQPSEGPGGAAYTVDSVIMEDFAQKQDGYWLFRPAEDIEIHEELIIFNHGYGAYNPMIYGAWIKHLVRKGNIVVFPRYQKNLISPKPKKFISNATVAIQSAILDLRERKLLTTEDFHLSLVGHSYGGVITAGLANNYQELGIPKPQAVMLCSPGSGPFKGGVLEEYSNIDAESKLLIMVSVNDHTVGEDFGRHVFRTSSQVENNNLIRQFPDEHQGQYISAGHNESYALDLQFDSGVRNVSAKRALRIGKIDPVDYYGYWKLFDALRSCSAAGNNCEIAFGNNPGQINLGEWNENEAIRPLVVYTDPLTFEAKK